MTADDNPVYAIGPGSRVRSRGPVVGAYAETDALTRACPECLVEKDAWCVQDGWPKKVPCVKRYKQPEKHAD